MKKCQILFLPEDWHDSWYEWVQEIETILNESYHDTIENTSHEALLGDKSKKKLGKLVQTGRLK